MSWKVATTLSIRTALSNVMFVSSLHLNTVLHKVVPHIFIFCFQRVRLSCIFQSAFEKYFSWIYEELSKFFFGHWAVQSLCLTWLYLKFQRNVLFVCLNHLTLIYDSFKHKRTPWRFPCMFGQVLHSSNETTELGWEPTCDVTCLDLDNVGSDLHHHLLVHHSCHLTDQCPLGSMCPGQPPFIGKHKHLLRGQVTHDHLNAQN